MARLPDIDDDLPVFCPECAEREFGPSGFGRTTAYEKAPNRLCRDETSGDAPA
jgi:hypothetical protein